MIFFFGKRIFYLLLIAFVLACATSTSAATGPGKQSQVQGQPLIIISSSNYDFGQVMEGTEVEHAFTVKNPGTGVLNIDRVKTS